MEIAYHMQTEAPDVFDIRKESEATRQRYGDGDFAHGCLMAARLVEHGVRIVQVYFGNGQPWDSHQDILEHRTHALQCDRPIAALIQDLKGRGLLRDTLVIVGTEFGRTPAIQLGRGVSNGRDHNPYGFTMLLAGGRYQRRYCLWRHDLQQNSLAVSIKSSPTQTNDWPLRGWKGCVTRTRRFEATEESAF